MSAIVKIETKLQSTLRWAVKHSSTSQRYIGACEPLNIVLEADSLDEMYSLINESLQLLFADLLSDNELDAFLRKKGWTAVNLCEAGSSDGVTFDVPWELVAAGASRDFQRSAH
jgi:hypothetical protein